MIRAFQIFIGLLVPSLLSCNTVGPKAVAGARVEYNTAIANSWNEQLLLNLVRMRYGEHPVFLELNSLSTQYNLGVGAHIEPIFERPDQNIVTRSVNTQNFASAGLSRSRTTGPGSDDEYQNGVSFEYYERPTITYSPLQGQTYVSQILSPITTDSLMLLVGSGWGLERVFSICVQRLNALPNAPGASGPAPTAAPETDEFVKVMRLIRALSDEDAIISQVRNIGNFDRLSIAFDPKYEDDERLVQLRKLLGLPLDKSEYMVGNFWVSSVRPAIAIEPRSLMGVLYYLSLSVDIPAEHVSKGWVYETLRDDGEPYDWSELLGSLIHVQCSGGRPNDAYVSVHYGKHWFYIARSDVASKVTLSFLSTLFYLQAGEVDRQGPLLTLPLSQ